MYRTMAMGLVRAIEVFNRDNEKRFGLVAVTDKGAWGAALSGMMDARHAGYNADVRMVSVRPEVLALCPVAR